MDPDLNSKGCKGHPKLIITPTNPLIYLLGPPLLILLGPHLLRGLIHPHTILKLILIHFTLMPSHNLNGIHLKWGGEPNKTLLPPFCLHHRLNHNRYLLLLQYYPRFLLNRTQTPTIDRPNRYILGRQDALPMLWRSRRSTRNLERSFQSANLLP